MSKLRFFLVGLPLALSAGATAISACSSKTDEAAPLNVQDGGEGILDSSVHPTGDGSLTKPRRRRRTQGRRATPSRRLLRRRPRTAAT